MKQGITRDITSPKLLCLKGAVFIIAGLLSCTLILLLCPRPVVALLLLIAIWAFCRAYYFAFYVIEKYIDPSYKFDGVISALRFLAGKNSRQ